MPVVIYIFCLCAFAIGLTEFITIGLLPQIANDLQVGISDVGLTVTLYATGVVIGAPVLTALSSRLSRKTVIIGALIIFTLGNLQSAFAQSLTLLLVGRFLCGLAHGVFFAVAASVAARLVSPERSGSALSLVFGGVTIAMAFGVPIGSWAGSIMPWQFMFIAITVCSALGCMGIAALMPRGAGELVAKATGLTHLTVLFNTKLLAGAGVPMLSYMGSFVLYTYITPILNQETGGGTTLVSIAMLAYGVGSALGIVAGGRLSDRLGMDNASLIFLLGIAVSLIAVSFAIHTPMTAILAIAALGFTTYGVLPGLQARILMLAGRHAPHALDIASGMNIAAFNSGVVVGSAAGAVSMSQLGFSWLAPIGAAIAIVATLTLVFQLRIPSMNAMK